MNPQSNNPNNFYNNYDPNNYNLNSNNNNNNNNNNNQNFNNNNQNNFNNNINNNLNNNNMNNNNLNNNNMNNNNLNKNNFNINSNAGVPDYLLDVPEDKQTKTEKTINFYKFLLYSIKIEQKILEFFNIMRSSAISEISVWVLSACILASIPTNLEITNKHFVWVHIFHLLRAANGIVLIFRLPKTYEIIPLMENDVLITKEKTYNEILREVGNREIMPKIEANKWFLVGYFLLTFVNMIIDIIDFISTLGNVDPNIEEKSYIYITFGYLVIALLYISILIQFKL